MAKQVDDYGSTQGQLNYISTPMYCKQYVEDERFAM